MIFLMPAYHITDEARVALEALGMEIENRGEYRTYGLSRYTVFLPHPDTVPARMVWNEVHQDQFTVDGVRFIRRDVGQGGYGSDGFLDVPTDEE